MSKNYNRAKLNRANDNHHYQILFLKFEYGYYYEEGWTWRNSNLPNHKWRSYRTWKHNRKKQFKS